MSLLFFFFFLNDGAALNQCVESYSISGMINTNLPFLMNTLNTRLIYGKGLEVSMCKGTKESTGRFAPHLADAHRTLKTQRPGRRQR